VWCLKGGSQAKSADACLSGEARICPVPIVAMQPGIQCVALSGMRGRASEGAEECARLAS
jgi:hypothetical protein